jgi:hypothetical protein
MVQNGERPIIKLEDDHPKPMGIILRILHFQSLDIKLELSRAEFCAIAIHSDKYDCARARRGWTSGWRLANNFNKMYSLESDEIGFTLLAAYLLRFQDLPELATQATRYLAPSSISGWSEHDTLSRIPETLTSTLDGFSPPVELFVN